MHNRLNQNNSQSSQSFSYFDQNQPINNQTQSTQYQINQINSKLEHICHERLSNLTNPTAAQVKKTLQLIEFLIIQIKKLQDAKIRAISQRRQVELALLQSTQATDKITKDKKILENQKQTLSQKVKSLENSLKQIFDKYKLQKQDLQKQIKQFQTRQKTYQNQFRRKELQLKETQDKIKKYQEKHHFINNFEVLQKFPREFNTSGLQYTRFAHDKFDKIISQLTKQNDHLRSYLAHIYKQFRQLAQEIKISLKKSQNLQREDEDNMVDFKEGLFTMPIQKNQEMLIKFIQSIRKLKERIKSENRSHNQLANKKQGEIDGTKEIIDNYKHIINFQGQFIHNFFSQPQSNYQDKTKEERRSFLNEMGNSSHRLKKFIEEYAAKYEEKNKNFQSRIQGFQETRKLMQENKAYVKNNVKTSDHEGSRQMKN